MSRFFNMDEIGELIQSGQTIEVVLQGGAPWGFSLKGGAEHHCPLTIAKIEPGGKVSQAQGIRVDDVVVGINGVPCDQHFMAIQLVKTAHHSLSLTVYRGSAASDFRGPKSPDLRKQAQENAAMMKHTMYSVDNTDPAPKEVAEQKPVFMRKKKEGQAPVHRPKSWHTDGRTYSQPDLTKVPSPSKIQEPPQPSYKNPPSTSYGYNQFHSASESSFLQSGRSIGSLNNNNAEDGVGPTPGFVKKKKEAYEHGLSHSMDRINEEHSDLRARRMWNEHQTITQGVNPKLRNIELEIEPAETYPKVVMATQINSAQSKAVLGRLPDSGDQRGQRYGGRQDVSIHAVQMPQRQIASSADSAVRRNFVQAQSNLSSQSQTSYMHSIYRSNIGNPQGHNDGTVPEKRIPPVVPKREDSMSKTQAYCGHTKAQSWPESTSSPDSTSTVTISQAIHHSEVPPVKLYSGTEKGHKSPPNSASHPNPNKNSNSATQEIYKASPVWYDEANNKMFSYGESKLQDGSFKFDFGLDATSSPPSPPTRDIDHIPTKHKGNSSRGTDKRYDTKDHLIQDYRKYLEEAEEQQESLRLSMETGNLEQDSPSPYPSLSRTQNFDSATSVQKTESAPLARTMPAAESTRTSWYAEVEKRRNRLSSSSQDALTFSETEMNKRNSLMGQSNGRTWRNPSDKRDDEWQRAGMSTSNERQTRLPQQPQPQQPTPPRKSSHSRQSSDIDSANAPRMRSPISPMLVENFKPPKQSYEMPKHEESRAPKSEQPREEYNLSSTIGFGSEIPANSILSRLKREGSFKDRQAMEAERSEGNEALARKIVAPDTKRDARQLGLSDDVFRSSHRSGKSNHSKTGSFHQDIRGPAAPSGNMDSRLNKTAPIHQRTHSSDIAQYSTKYVGRLESVDRRSESERRVSRENSFTDHPRNVQDTRKYWKRMDSQQQSTDIDRSDHKKSKSDSDKQPNVEDRRKKISDPSDKIPAFRKVSDPDSKYQIKEALKNFVQTKRSPTGSQSSPSSSRPPSISNSEQSLSRYDEMYHSNISLSSYGSSSRHHWQDSISSVGSYSSQPPHHQAQDSGFGSSNDLSQVRSHHSPPQTGVVSQNEYRLASTMSFEMQQSHSRPVSAPISRSSSVSQLPTQYPPNPDRRRSQQHYTHHNRLQYQRMSLDSAVSLAKGQERSRLGQISPEDRSRVSPTKQMSPAGSYNSNIAERKTIPKVTEEEETVPEVASVYRSLQPESLNIFQFPPTGKVEPMSTTSTSPQKTLKHFDSPPKGSSGDHRESGDVISPPPPPTPVTPWEGKDMDFPPPPPELVSDGHASPADSPRSSPRQSPKQSSPRLSPVEQTVQYSTKEGSKPQLVMERVTPVRAESVQQAPSALEVQVEPVPVSRQGETTPSLSPNSISGRSSPDESRLSPQHHAPRLANVPENIVLPSDQRETTRNLNALSRFPEDANEATDSDKEEGDEIDSGRRDNAWVQEQVEAEKEAVKEIEQESNPLFKWVLQSLTPNRLALADLFPLPSQLQGGQQPGDSIRMTNMDEGSEKAGSTTNESEVAAEPRNPSECINLVLSSSRYLRISPAKAILLKRAKGMSNTDDLGNNNAELRKTQEELVERISKKVEDIKQMQTEVATEMSSLEEMKRQVMECIKIHCKASEYNKCNMYVADIDRVTRLLLSLTRRISKVDSVLGSMENSEEEEKANLEKLRENLNSQYRDAKKLKESIVSRHGTISRMLLDKLANDKHDDFCHYVTMLPRLLIMVQELEDKVKLGEEQLEALRESLRQMSIGSIAAETGAPRDSNGNVHRYKDNTSSCQAMPSSPSATMTTTTATVLTMDVPEEYNRNATSSYC
ncbi:uncharacterized protein [Diadema antillarum]|uniref:uncharacterized protein n=1 Tax=Diadema antillarum TaxID=105358 RepID=UPI003A87EB9B